MRKPKALPVLTPGTVIDRGPRFGIRCLQTEDVVSMVRIYGDPRVAQYVGDSQPLTQAACEAWLSQTLVNYQQRGYGLFAVFEPSDSMAVIGFAGLVHPGGQEDVEIKYALDPRFWGQGLATAVAHWLIDWGMAVHGIRRFVATIDPENVASRRILERCGFLLDRTGVDADGLPTAFYIRSSAADG